MKYVAVILFFLNVYQLSATTIHEAARSGDIVTLKQLIQNKALVDELDDNHNTALQCAASSGQLKAAEYLLSHKANINTRNKFNSTPLHGAVASGNENLVLLFLISGAQANQQDRGHNCPVTLAFVNKHFEIAQTLTFLDQGSALMDRIITLIKNPKLPDHAVALIKFLTKHYRYPLDMKDGQGKTLLYYATAYNHKPALRSLLGCGADPGLAINIDDLYHGSTVATFLYSDDARGMLQIYLDAAYKNSLE